MTFIGPLRDINYVPLIIVNTLALSLATFIFYQYTFHSVWWSGIMESATAYLFHKHLDYKKEIKTGQDGENYIIWWPKTKRIGKRSKHLWICIPGAMKKYCEFVEVLETNYNAFEGSDVCVYNQPGIESGTKMKHRPIPTPTDICYLFEFIQSIHSQNAYSKVSVIGCSMGGVTALFLVDKLSQYEPKKYVQQIVMIHSPECIRVTFEHLHKNWLFRFDIICARSVYLFCVSSGTWNKFGIGRKMKTKWYDGWPFMREITEHILGEKWEHLEPKWHDQHRVILKNEQNEKIECCDLKRIISKNDPIIHYESIDEYFFKYYDELIVLNKGGHCIATNAIAQKIIEWNNAILNKN